MFPSVHSTCDKFLHNSLVKNYSIENNIIIIIMTSQINRLNKIKFVNINTNQLSGISVPILVIIKTGVWVVEQLFSARFVRSQDRVREEIWAE